MTTMIQTYPMTRAIEHPQICPSPLKVYTLGRFALVLHNETVRFQGKVKKKPLELLKALIALGGRQVSHEHISDALWPDAEGDAAQINFKTTLHRLRKVIGAEAIIVQDGKVTLNDRYCWSDVWAFERLLSALELRITDHNTTSSGLIAVLEACAALHQGPFLSRDSETVWSLALREKLRSRWLRVLRNSIVLLGERGECEAVVYWYEKAIEMNPVAEECYRGLMGCLAGLGQRAEALAIYDRCRKMLAAHLGIEPSAKTTAFYTAIKQDEIPSTAHTPCESTATRSRYVSSSYAMAQQPS